MIIGHETILGYFETALREGLLHHVYCLVGVSQVGKRTLARQVAAQLLGTTPEKLSLHPDFVYMERAEDEKDGRLKKEISVEQARAFRARLSNRSWSGGYQVAIINEAEFFNEESANALLKTLEEPTLKTIIFLLVENENTLLPTIRSRSCVVQVPLVPSAVVAEGIARQGITGEKNTIITALSAGRPGRALELSAHEDVYQEALAEITRWTELCSLPLYERVQRLEPLFGSAEERGAGKADTIRQRGKLDVVLSMWQLLWREVLLAGIDNSHNSSLLPTGIPLYAPNTVQAVMDRLDEARNLMRANIHPRLLVERVLLAY